MAVQLFKNQFILNLRVKPNARKSHLIAVTHEAIELAIQAPARDGEANDAVLDFLSDIFAAKRRQFELIGGLKSRDKRVRFSPETRFSTTQDILQHLQSLLQT